MRATRPSVRPSSEPTPLHPAGESARDRRRLVVGGSRAWRRAGCRRCPAHLSCAHRTHTCSGPTGAGMGRKRRGLGRSRTQAAERRSLPCSDHPTVYNYARRGRGESVDTLTYAVRHEIEDNAELMAEAGGSAHLVRRLNRWRSGAGAAAAGLGIEKVGVRRARQRSRRLAAQMARLPREARGATRRGDAPEHFMRWRVLPRRESRGPRARSSGRACRPLRIRSLTTPHAWGTASHPLPA